MDCSIPLGEKRVFDGQERVYYYGYWVKTYEAPDDTLGAKKRLIEATTRRLFNHMEHGINIPGARLNEARAAYEAETDPATKRVKGAMYAGALFNRATDIFTKLVELQAAGVEIAHDNALMRECGFCLQEALELGKLVRHRSGDEGLDELWGEPFKVFSIPIEAFYESRYIKIAQTMRDIDRIAESLAELLSHDHLFNGVAPLIARFAEAARCKTETLRTDPNIFEIWAQFAVAADLLETFRPPENLLKGELQRRRAEIGLRMIRRARRLICDITRARVPMPKSTAELLARFEALGSGCAPARAATPA